MPGAGLCGGRLRSGKSLRLNYWQPLHCETAVVTTFGVTLGGLPPNMVGKSLELTVQQRQFTNYKLSECNKNIGQGQAL